MTFRYWIVPLSGKPNNAALCRLGQRLAGGLRVVHAQPVDIRLNKTSAPLPAEKSFIRIDGDAVVTSLRQVDSAWELRMFNPSEEGIQAAIRGSFTRAVPVNFESQPVGTDIAAQNGRIGVSFKPKQILTLRLIVA